MSYPYFFTIMDYLQYATLFILIIYGWLIIYFLWGWWQLKPLKTQPLDNKVYISVIVPYRDEAHNLKSLIRGLANQRFSGQFEAIMVDDGSKDHGPNLIKKLKEQYTWLKMSRSDGVGKKAAIRHGIKHAKGELIVTTDADCIIGESWLQTICDFYQLNNPDMIVMPVKLKDGSSILDIFQQMDYLAMQIVTAGATGIGKPIICSGANLAFTKEAYLKTSPSMAGQDYLSGDDVFLLHAFKKHNQKISYLKSQKVIVEAQPAPTTQKFLEQRIRWGGKSKGYKDFFTLITVAIVFLSNFSMALLPITTILQNTKLMYVIGFWVFKISLDALLLTNGKKFFSIRTLSCWYIPFSFIYPYYLVFTALSALIKKEQWKRRQGK